MAHTLNYKHRRVILAPIKTLIMKKLFFITVASALCITACNTATTNAASTNTGSDVIKKNVAAFNFIIKSFVAADTSAIDSIMTADYIDHNDNDKGRDSIKTVIIAEHNNAKDVKAETVHITADSEYVYGWIRYSGTSDGGPGKPKESFSVNVIELFKFRDGKATEHWILDMPKKDSSAIKK